MRVRTARGVAVTVAAGLALAACAQGTSDPGGGGEAAEDLAFDSGSELSGEMEIMGFALGDDVAESRFERAEEALGDVTINHVEGALDIQQFLTSVASGNPPDVIYAARDQIGSFASRGAIMPLTQCIEGEGIEIDDYRDNTIEQVTFNDEVYGIPEFNTVQITMANQDLLGAAGLTIEDVNGKDWDAITAANQALMKTSGGKLSVIGYDSKLPEFFPLWAKANGVDILSEDARTAHINDPAALEALEFAFGIYQAQGGFGNVKAFRDSADFFGEGNQYASNTLGAMPMEQWYINILNDVSPDAPVAFDAFYGLDGEPLSYAGGSAWAITADAANPEAACRYARVMTEVDTWIAAAENRIALREQEGGIFTGLLTGNERADEMIREMVPDAGEPWNTAIDAMYQANDNAVSAPASPADAEVKTAWEDAINRVLNGQQEPKAALDQAQEEAQAALDKAWAAVDEG
ncbi:extracellular solute-binding protein [Georgenia sp. TF02-10]|uniref:extracellular solute-binding protein n=1 Tax=Georgenia sp. TF02-10 TaxID=2917725 RepID=UPI001FA7342A|nr:extracellular solute-binding protein [Georgenia sp. TF02-10]UNX56268.1 extracellular solute-binding protein [Georgenia sp. TF02-10]